MVRGALYFLGLLLALVMLLIFVVMAVVAMYGIAVLRSDAFGLVVTGYVLIGGAAALISAVWLARRRR